MFTACRPVSRRSDLRVLGLCDFNLDGLTLTFAALRQPSAKIFSKSLWRNAKARFNFSFRNGQCVIKFRGIRKVAHTELIEPFQRTGTPNARHDYVDLKPLRVHILIIARFYAVNLADSYE